MSKYEDYYKAKLEAALLYQDFVVDVAYRAGLIIAQYGSRAFQMGVGESRTGVEIKHDEMFGKTGNLWIEVAEKSNPVNLNYVRSGIYRQDNTWLYVIGDYNTIFVFAKRFLIALHKSSKYRQIENRTKTSQGFLLPEQDSLKYAALVLKPGALHLVNGKAADSSELASELHRLVLNANQLQLFEGVV